MQTQAIQPSPAFFSLDSYIASTPDVLSGKPCIANTRIAVTHVKAWRLALGMSEAEIAADYNLPIAAVYAAMSYYYAHKAEIDRRDAEEAVKIEALRTQYPSKLAAKLAASHE